MYVKIFEKNFGSEKVHSVPVIDQETISNDHPANFSDGAPTMLTIYSDFCEAYVTDFVFKYR